MEEATSGLDESPGEGRTPPLAALGAFIDTHGVDGEDLGWASGTWTPEGLACTPAGVVPGGVHALLLDAIMNVAVDAALPRGDRSIATGAIRVEILSPARGGGRYEIRGEVVRLARREAHTEGSVVGPEGLVCRATATYLVQRGG